MKNFLNSFLGTLCAIVVLVLIGGGYGACVAGKKSKIEDGSYLVLELQGDLPEYDPPGGILGRLGGGGGETLQRVLSNLEKAALDERVSGLIVRASSSAAIGAASVEEIRGAVGRFRASGKPAYVWVDSFDERLYPLLAAFEQIWAPPSAYITFTGFATGSTHVKRALDKLGIKPELHKIKDYKSAAEMVTRENMSEPARENDQWLLDDYWERFCEILQQDRGIGEDRALELMQHALFTAEEAREAGLIDELRYWDEVEAQLKDEDDDELTTVDAKRYAAVDPSKFGLEGKKTIAVVHAQGIIAGRESGVNPLLGITMGHESIVAELRRARLDEDVAAVVFRIDSRGGDALGSDLMGHEVEVTTAVKPVVASMVDVAASGGYHIAYRASRILADPMTMTGSIGSISGKFNMAGLYDKLGVSFDSIERGPNALLDSELHDYTPEQQARFEENHWAGFNDWLRDVAEHRGMSFEEAEKLAHGRVWTGRQAAANGLVDELGDLTRAIEVAKELAGIPAEDGVTVVHYPEAKGLLASLMGGDAAAAARWAVYRTLREEAAATWSIVREQPALLLDPLAR